MTLKDIDLNNKRVIIRCDFNVPIKDNKILDDRRIIESLKTINYVKERASKVILLSHLGRIKTVEDKEKNSLKIVCDYLSNLIKEEIAFYDYTNDKVLNNKIIMFENTRYFDLDNKKESNCDENLSKYFASFGDIFINDAFGTCHRKNSSNVGISKYLPSANGFLVEKEIKMLNKIKNNPERPYIVIIGGAKVKDKIPLINSLIENVDKLIISGGMAFTFLKAMNYNIGKSVFDEDSYEFVKTILKKYNDKIILPLDFYVSKTFSNENPIYRKINEINDDEIGLDVGPETIKEYKKELEKSKTVFVNGPIGVFEFSNFSNGTIETFKILKNIKNVVIGGGDSANAVKELGFYFENVSTGGGASLEYIEGNKLPGLFEE